MSNFPSDFIGLLHKQRRQLDNSASSTHDLPRCPHLPHTASIKNAIRAQYKQYPTHHVAPISPGYAQHRKYHPRFALALLVREVWSQIGKQRLQEQSQFSCI
eukprot:1160104-Pelagomonas_calceolata.AAC.20